MGLHIQENGVVTQKITVGTATTVLNVSVGSTSASISAFNVIDEITSGGPYTIASIFPNGVIQASGTLPRIATGVISGLPDNSDAAPNGSMVVSSTNGFFYKVAGTYVGPPAVSGNFITFANDASLSNQRVLTAGSGITISITSGNASPLTIANTLVTGLSGGQSITGGTNNTDSLTLFSTSAGTPGFINLGNYAAFDEQNIRLGLGTNAPIFSLDIQRNFNTVAKFGSSMPVYTGNTGTTTFIGFNAYYGSSSYLLGTGSSSNYGYIVSADNTTGNLNLYNTVAGNADTSATPTQTFAFTNSSELHFFNGNSYYVGLKAPASLTGNTVWTLPLVDGTVGQSLTTSGVGVLSWETLGGNIGSPVGSGTANSLLYVDSSTNLAQDNSRLTWDDTGYILNVKGELKLSGSTSGFTALKAAATAGSTVFTLPSADGTSAQALVTDGAGNLSFTTISGGGGGGGVLPSAALIVTSYPSIAAGTNVQVTGFARDFDNSASNAFTATANQFTIPTTGVYAVSLMGALTPNSNYGDRFVFVTLNASTPAATNLIAATDAFIYNIGSVANFNVSNVAFAANAGDVVSAWVYCGTTANTSISSSTNCRFSIAEVGISGGGGVTGGGGTSALPEVASISTTAGMSIPNNAWTQVTCGTVDFDTTTGNLYTGTSNCITVPSNGYYEFTGLFEVYYNAVGDVTAGISLLSSLGTPLGTAREAGTPTGASVVLNLNPSSGPVYLTTGSQVCLVAYQNSGSTQSILGSGVEVARLTCLALKETVSGENITVLNPARQIELDVFTGYTDNVGWPSDVNSFATFGGVPVTFSGWQQSTIITGSELDFDVFMSAGTWTVRITYVINTDGGTANVVLDGAVIGTINSTGAASPDSVLVISGVSVGATGSKRLSIITTSSGYTRLQHISLVCTSSGIDASTVNSAQTMECIASIVVGSTTNTIEFTSLSQDYEHLVFEAQMSSTYTGGLLDTAGITLNGDTGSNYDYQYVEGAGSTTTATEGHGYTWLYNIAVPDVGSMVGSQATTATLKIPFYTRPFNKLCDINIGQIFDNSAGHLQNVNATTQWRSTAAVTDVKFLLANGNFVVGSRVVCYGIRSTNSNGASTALAPSPPVGLYIHSNTTTPNTQVDYSIKFAPLLNGNVVKNFKSFSGTIDATTNGANGLDTGSLANSTIYILYAIGKPDGTTSMCLSTNTTSPALPSGYTYYRPVGWVITDGSAHIQKFRQNGDVIRWNSSVYQVYNATTPGASIQTATTTSVVPSVFCRDILMVSQISTAGTDLTFFGPDSSSGGDYFLAACAYDTRYYWLQQNSSGQFYWQGASGSGNILFNVLGAKFDWY